jgi:hypothetical protein
VSENLRGDDLLMREAVASAELAGARPARAFDAVNPKHYQGDLVMRVIEHFGLDDSFYLGNVIKYLLRHRDKAGVEDLKKARWYLDRAIDAAEHKLPKGTIK